MKQLSRVAAGLAMLLAMRCDGQSDDGPDHLELCGVGLTCKDGVVSGLIGYSCAEYSGTCPYGCRQAEANGSGPRLALMGEELREVLNATVEQICNPPPRERGAGGQGGEAGAR